MNVTVSNQSGGGSSPSTGQTQTAAPTYATEVGYVDNLGFLQPLSGTSATSGPNFSPPPAVMNTGSVTAAGVLLTQDCSQFQSASIHVTSIGTGCTVQFQVSNDNVNWYSCAVMPGGDLTGILATTTTVAGAFTTQLNSRYFRVNCSVYGSGTVTATCYFKNFGNSPNSVGGYVSALNLDGAGNAITSTGNALDVNLKTSPLGLATSALQTVGNSSLSTIASNTTGASTAANQATEITALQAIQSNTNGGATAANQTTGNNSLSTIATNSGTQATAANQTTGNNSLATIATNSGTQATSALQTAGNSSLTTIAGGVGKGPVDLTATGNITAASTGVAIALLASDATAHVEVTGTWVGTLQFQLLEADNATWVNYAIAYPGIAGAAVASTTANGVWSMPLYGYKGIRLYCTAYTSGTAAVSITATNGTMFTKVIQDTASNLQMTATISSGTISSATVTPTKSTLTDGSGTTSATVSTATTAAAVNASRKYLYIQNCSSSATIWINFTTTAVASQPSIPLPPLAAYVQESGFISTELISVISTTASVPYVLKQS